jgi:hypothetical protein
MKRMRPEERKSVAYAHIVNLAYRWQCQFGEWNRDKLLLELERTLRARRLEKKKDEHAAS